ncbi:MAG: prenyltransferase/squalene oxidase repeat-containing protein [Planctomycetota bacterium]
MPPMPPSPSGPRGPGQPKTLVGGLPWQKPAEPKSEFDVGPQIVTGMPLIEPPAAGRPGMAANQPAEPRSLQQRIDDWVRKSPPFSVSLSAHIVVLLMLALIFYPREEVPAISIDLSFVSEEVVEEEEEEKGVQIVAPEEPEKEPEPEVVETEKPPVEDPVAAPVMVEEVVDTGAGATAAAVPQNVPIGSLLDGRQEGRREALVRAFGGSDATEAAVAKALLWLAKQQGKDGLWSLQGPYVDGGSKENPVAATAMALLAFQGAGNTPRQGRHKAVVAKAWQALLKRQLPDGQFDVPPLPSHHMLYTHGQATFAICEVFGMTKDRAFADPARRALAFAVAAQGPNGGWRYSPGEPGDMSVTGWFMLALMSGKMAGLTVPQNSLDQITTFLDTVSVEGGTRYGYMLESPQKPPARVTHAISAEGLLSRQFLGWQRDDERIAAGLERLLADKFLDYENGKDVYAWYYITQVAHNVGGEVWERWNGRMREVLPQNQVPGGSEAGSWDPSLDEWGFHGGRLFTTCFSTYMLEVYYRHLPLYQAVAVE